jgi:cob(I)alamin adenosyltransferase
MKKNDGSILIYTGNGKGKTTAALGTALRSLGYNWKVCMIQFIKGDWHYGELDSVQSFGKDFEIHRMGKGFYHIMGDRLPDKIHREAAEKALAFARDKMISGQYHLIILDEVLVSVNVKLLSEDALLDFIKDKPAHVHLILTGRGATDRIIEVADLVTEMKEIKHPYQKGIPGKKGIDF